MDALRTKRPDLAEKVSRARACPDLVGPDDQRGALRTVGETKGAARADAVHAFRVP